MDDHITTDPVKEDPSVGQVPETATLPDDPVENGEDKEKEPKIEIKQVPMDGVCGGY